MLFADRNCQNASVVSGGITHYRYMHAPCCMCYSTVATRHGSLKVQRRVDNSVLFYGIILVSIGSIRSHDKYDLRKPVSV
jgi:hypothetical protein